ncbi:MAG: alpha/beta fold hydrolase [Bradyrhizobium sp.]|nr:alpha/beta fold hydrolase [Bradyrhizobium sp.]
MFAENFAVYGVRKVWRQMMREGHPIARCTVARLMREMSLVGVIGGKPVRTTISDKAAPCPLDHVNRRFCAPAPNMLWVSDFTYVAAWAGFVYVAFVIDTYTQRSFSNEDLPTGRMHYIDEGSGPVLLFVHGNPSWSFEFRRLVRHFAVTYRCIAIDHLGFGLSDKPDNASYRPQFHAENLRLSIGRLGLDNIILVCHDWGGPIALDVAVEHPDQFRAVIALNSWFFDVRGYTILRRFSRIVGSRLGRSLCRRLNLSPKILMKASFGQSSRLGADVHRHYLAPFSTPASREGTWVFPKSIIGESPWLDAIWTRRSRLESRPALLIWGMKDAAFAPLLTQWQETFADHRTILLDDVGHNVAEEAGDRLIDPIAAFLSKHAQ